MGAVDVWEDEVHHVEPSGDQSLPAEPSDEPPNLPEYCSLPLRSLDPRLTVQSLKRQGDTLESGPTKEPRAERGTLPEVNMEEYGIFQSNEDHLRLALVPAEHQNAIQPPAPGWSNYRTLYEFDPPAPLADADLRVAALFPPVPKTSYSR